MTQTQKPTDQRLPTTEELELARQLAQLQDQMLSVLVRDLGYTHRPWYGHEPIRHQVAWELAGEDPDNVTVPPRVLAILEQAKRDRETIGRYYNPPNGSQEYWELFIRVQRLEALVARLAFASTAALEEYERWEASADAGLAALIIWACERAHPILTDLTRDPTPSLPSDSEIYDRAIVLAREWDRDNQGALTVSDVIARGMREIRDGRLLI